jgi:hypothetical protein
LIRVDLPGFGFSYHKTFTVLVVVIKATHLEQEHLHFLPQPTGPQTAKTSPFWTEIVIPETLKAVPLSWLSPASLLEDEVAGGDPPRRNEAFSTRSGISPATDPSDSSMASGISEIVCLDVGSCFSRSSRFRNLVIRSTADSACAASVTQGNKTGVSDMISK